MAISECSVYKLTCDGCHVDYKRGFEGPYHIDLQDMIISAGNEGWRNVDDKFYCERCLKLR